MVIFLDMRGVALYIINSMKNLESLKTGNKPAPGELVIVQGFINTFDMEGGVDEIGTSQALKVWLVHHGLVRANDNISADDFRGLLEFREALRRLIAFNSGELTSQEFLHELNEIVSKCRLNVSFGPDGSILLSTTDRGITGVIGQLLALIAKAAGDGTWARMKACSDPSCRWIYYDNSKNQSGRWCSMSVCGSRDKARAYRRRRSAN